MKIIIGILHFLLTMMSCFGQNFRGLILDQESNLAIPDVQVFFVDLKTGTATDKNGFFRLDNVLQKKMFIQITHLGYRSVEELVHIDSISEKTFYLEQEHQGLNEVVFSDLSGKLKKETILNIEQKNITELLQNSPLTLAEAISNIKGVDQTTRGLGVGKLVIRGLSANRIGIFTQGIRIDNQQWGSEYSMGIGEVGIESVEIIKGPASLLYGPNVTGGLVYFVDERYANQNTIEGFAQTDFFSNTLGSKTKMSVKLNKNRIKFNLFGSYYSHGDYQLADFDRIFNTRFNEKNIKSSFGFDMKNWISDIRYSFLQNNFGIVKDSILSSVADRNFIAPFQSFINHNLSCENKFFIKKSTLDLTLGYSNNYFNEIEDDFATHYFGLLLHTTTYNLKWHSPLYKDLFSFIIGSQGNAQTNKNDGNDFLTPNGRTRDLGYFGVFNIELNKFKLQAGLRLDSREIDSQEMISNENNFQAYKIDYSGLTQSGGVNYQNNKLRFVAYISTGFRAPNIVELTTNGIQIGTNRYVVGNSELNSERTTQIDLSCSFENKGFSFSVNPYCNYIKDYTFLSPSIVTYNTSPVFGYIQKDAILYGGELSVYFHPYKVHWLHLETNLSTTIAQDKNGIPLANIPQTKSNSIIKVEFSTNQKIKLKQIYLQHIYKFSQNRIGFFETASNYYNLINMGLKIEIHKGSNPIEINTSINNMLNTSYIDHLSQFKTLNLPNQGISFTVGLKTKLSSRLINKKIGD